ncbi:MAG TPA: SHOCT domain-containing protein [Spirochaetota bacterium]|nr:SHOCT domain-containing protein [Spirochaetota bacterium]HPI87820.1 SHOCT domain-containing protein [Spirochaetota bacterium]HPR47547.1 SHOCT domain-containing protein [Spirochaetota bacterium]
MKKIILMLLAVPVLSGIALAQWGGGCLFGMPGFGGHFGFGGGIFMWIITIALLGALVYFGVRSLKNSGSSAENDPLKILKSRYARGEITKDEFESMKKDLLS